MNTPCFPPARGRRNGLNTQQSRIPVLHHKPQLHIKGWYFPKGTHHHIHHSWKTLRPTMLKYQRSNQLRINAGTGKHHTKMLPKAPGQWTSWYQPSDVKEVREVCAAWKWHFWWKPTNHFASFSNKYKASLFPTSSEDIRSYWTHLLWTLTWDSADLCHQRPYTLTLKTSWPGSRKKLSN